MSASPLSERLRVLLLINDLARAGAETQLVELALGLDRDRYEVEIVLLKHRNDFQERLEAVGTRVTPLHRRGFWDLGVFARLYRVVRQRRPDVLHASLFLANLHGVLVGRLARVPVVIASKRTLYRGHLAPPLRLVAGAVHRAADRLVVNSRAALEEEREAGLSGDKLVYVPNGVRTAGGAPASRAALGLPDGPLVLAVGQLADYKGHAHLVEAWPEVRKRHPDARLVIVGEGPERPALESRVRALGVADSVGLPGFRPSDPGLFSACDVFVQPSTREGMPNAVLEAMAAGRPVVAARVGAVPDLVAEDAGILVPPGDPAALGDALSTLLADPARCGAAGSAAQRRASREFPVERMVERTEALYAALLAERRGSA